MGLLRNGSALNGSALKWEFLAMGVLRNRSA